MRVPGGRTTASPSLREWGGPAAMQIARICRRAFVATRKVLALEGKLFYRRRGRRSNRRRVRRTGLKHHDAVFPITLPNQESVGEGASDLELLVSEAFPALLDLRRGRSTRRGARGSARYAQVGERTSYASTVAPHAAAVGQLSAAFVTAAGGRGFCAPLRRAEVGAAMRWTSSSKSLPLQTRRFDRGEQRAPGGRLRGAAQADRPRSVAREARSRRRARGRTVSYALQVRLLSSLASAEHGCSMAVLHHVEADACARYLGREQRHRDRHNDRHSKDRRTGTGW